MSRYVLRLPVASLRRTLRVWPFFADPCALTTSGFVDVQEYDAETPPTSSLGFDENRPHSPCFWGRPAGGFFYLRSGSEPVLRVVANPPNPWATREVEYLDEMPQVRLQVFEDQTRTILSRNDPATVGFEFGLNPYRGCQHACAYCEARRRHQLLGFGAGTDFDAKIVVKPNAPALLREAFEAARWKGDVVVFSGATDCYQPLEASYRLTRACLEVCAEYRNPVAIITKGALIERDLDVLTQLMKVARVTVSISIPIWDAETARVIEPLVPSPRRRIRTVQRLAAAGLDVGVNLAPMIPGLSEDGMATLLGAARAAGAKRAVVSFLRLPSPVDTVFEERLRAELPRRAPRIMARVREVAASIRRSSGSSSEGEHLGAYGDMVASTFAVTCRRLGIEFGRVGDDRANTPSAGPLETRTFRRPAAPAGGRGRQLPLF